MLHVQASATRIHLVLAMEKAGQAVACMREEGTEDTRADAGDGSRAESRYHWLSCVRSRPLRGWEKSGLKVVLIWGFFYFYYLSLFEDLLSW